MQLTTEQKNTVLDIFKKADGEDMEGLISNSGWADYLLRALIMKSPKYEITQSIEERVELDKDSTMDITWFNTPFEPIVAKLMQSIKSIQRLNEEHQNSENNNEVVYIEEEISKKVKEVATVITYFKNELTPFEPEILEALNNANILLT